MKSRGKIKTRGKTSVVKQKNRLQNKGKLKTKGGNKRIFKRNKDKTMSQSRPEVELSDVADMVEDDDDVLKKSAVRSYNLLQGIRDKGRLQHKGRKKKSSSDQEYDELEEKYEETELPNNPDYNRKMLLPVKTKDGIQHRYAQIDEELMDADEENKENNIETGKNDKRFAWLESESGNVTIDINEPVSMAKIFARRENVIRRYKLRIGLLSSGLLENPEAKIGNLSLLLEIMGKSEPEVQITIKKLATLSLMEVFKDLVPAYEIKHQDTANNKLKKTTKELLDYEKRLLKGYKEFLVKLEKMANYLRRQKGDKRPIVKQQKGLAELAVRCLCELLVAHPYFNFSTNIVQLLTMYLDNADEPIRKMVENCYKMIFREDKRGLISLTIVRRINHLIKSRTHSVHCEALSVLLSLRIKNINLNQEKEDEIKNRKLHARKMKALSMSKKERKRKKQLQKVENEMLEAKAEENKRNRQQHLTEITKLVFLIYFRILKRAPRSNLLSVTLEGLAKFAHCINLEYYQDLMTVLNHLLENEPLKTLERLYCVKTVFVILSGYGDALHIDPAHFYTHLYKLLFCIHAGRSHDDAKLMLDILETVLIRRHKKVTTQRMLSFAKRLATSSLQMLPNVALGILSIIKSTVEVTNTADLLLDVDSSYGQGVYNPEMDEPEYCNAGNTSLWELCALQRHYHPVVCKMASHVAAGAPAVGESNLKNDIMKMNSIQFFEQYDPTGVVFNPPVPPPQQHSNKKLDYRHYESGIFKQYHKILEGVNDCNFSNLII